MAKQKLYFKSIDDTTCYPLKHHLAEAKIEGLETITLIEATPDDDNPDYVFCGHHELVSERSECKKSNCEFYSSKSGRGVCEHRGNLCDYGDEFTFKIDETATIIIYENEKEIASFSSNLMKFLRKHKHFRQIFLDPSENIWYIGYKDENGIWAGTKFLSALCSGSKTITFSYSKSVTDRFVERTDQFWKCAAYFGRRMFSKWYY